MVPHAGSGHGLYFVSTRADTAARTTSTSRALNTAPGATTKRRLPNHSTASISALPTSRTRAGNAILYFSSNRAGNQDIYFSVDFGPAQLVPELNTHSTMFDRTSAKMDSKSSLTRTGMGTPASPAARSQHGPLDLEPRDHCRSMAVAPNLGPVSTPLHRGASDPSRDGFTRSSAQIALAPRGGPVRHLHDKSRETYRRLLL